MTPYQLAKESESSQQMALFCFTAKAELRGFEQAKKENSYKSGSTIVGALNPVPELRWFFHCPNGGSRGDSAKSAAIAGGKLKAEGVKAGVMDCIWLLQRGGYAGLIIEMKKPSLKSKTNPLAGLSYEQLEFGDYANSQGYRVNVCYDWLEAAEVLQWYYELEK